MCMLEKEISWGPREAAHLLNRVGFGGTPDEVRKLQDLGHEGAVEWLLNVKKDESQDMPAWTGSSTMRLRELDVSFRASGGLRKQSAEVRKKYEELRREQTRERTAYSRELFDWWLDRITTSKTPLQEKMVLFWHDHFPVSAKKVRNPLFISLYLKLLRREAIGSFKELTHQMMNDPAMMLYLDSAQIKKEKPNENLARELLELFTLGEGNYSCLLYTSPSPRDRG